jgi:hypothetical protein
MIHTRGNKTIAYELAQLGVDARTIDGWVYVALHGSSLGAEAEGRMSASGPGRPRRPQPSRAAQP